MRVEWRVLKWTKVLSIQFVHFHTSGGWIIAILEQAIIAARGVLGAAEVLLNLFRRLSLSLRKGQHDKNDAQQRACTEEEKGAVLGDGVLQSFKVLGHKESTSPIESSCKGAGSAARHVWGDPGGYKK